MSEWRRARRQRGTKPGQKRRISALSRGLIQQKDGTAKFKSVGTAARVHARERESSEHVKGSSVRHDKRSTRSKDFSQRKQTTETSIDDHPAVPDDPTNHAVAECHKVVLDTTDELQWQSIPQTQKQATISDMLLLSRVRGRDKNPHLYERGHSP